MSIRSLVTAVPLLGLLGAISLACASSNTAAQTSPGDSGPSSSCDEIQSAARSTVIAVIDAHQDCAVDADCTSVALAVSNCFDSCTRNVSTGSVADVEAAKTKVDGAQCQDFRNKACKFTVPPCEPPSAPKCTKNKCTT